jgi:hypothetical protein
MKIEIISVLFRHGLTCVGGSLIAKGLIASSIFDEVTGGIVVVAGVVWSIASKVIADKINLKLPVAPVATPVATVESAKTV